MGSRSLGNYAFLAKGRRDSAGLKLADGSRVGVVGGGPAGSFFAYFLLSLAETSGQTIEVDVYEPRDFSSPAPAGCNMCGGIVSESLVQLLAAEGIVLPSSVIQRGIDSYVLHMDVGTVRIGTPLDEMRVGAVHRGLGPRDVKDPSWRSFDGFLQSMTAAKGARILRERVVKLGFEDGRPQVTSEESVAVYDLVTIAGGVNSPITEILGAMGIGYTAPRTAPTFIREYFLGKEALQRTLGNSMHVFLLDIPGLEFAAIIPKGEYATVCLLGDAVDKNMAERFMRSREVEAIFPPEIKLPSRSCQCAPRINVRGARPYFADRVLILGDCGVARLYKDGIGSAYRTAKVAAATALFHGVSAESFARHFRPVVESIVSDNGLGRIAFGVTRQIQAHRFARRGLLRMTAAEQQQPGHARRMSQVLWDVFTGSAPYRSVLARSMHPAFLGRLLVSLVSANVLPSAPRARSGAGAP
jgi:flavin-dependent dehydrogenase